LRVVVAVALAVAADAVLVAQHNTEKGRGGAEKREKLRVAV
jgi:hypothetical protein